jgi:hypothetical protein
MTRALAAALLATALCAGGCADARAVAGAKPDAAMMPAFRAGPLRPTTQTVRASDLLRAPGSLARYRVIGGNDVGSVLEERVTREADGRLALTKALISAGKPAKAVERLLLVEEPDGARSLREVETFSEDSRSLFDSGLAFAAAVLAPGTPLEGRSPMRVRTLASGAARAKGDATRSLRIAGESDIEIGSERWIAIVLDFEFVASLDSAKARVTSTIYVVPGRGVVAESREEKLLIMVIFPRNTSERTVLETVELEGLAPAPATEPAKATASNS